MSYAIFYRSHYTHFRIGDSSWLARSSFWPSAAHADKLDFADGGTLEQVELAASRATEP